MAVTATTPLSPQRRHLSRRAADHHHRRHAGCPHLRHRPRRGAAGPPGNAVRRKFQVGRLPDHHQQAVDRRLRRRVDVEGNTVDHGDRAMSSKASSTYPGVERGGPQRRLRRARADFIDNVYGTRPFYTSGVTANNAAFVKNNFNPIDTYGGRAPLKIDLNDSWTVTPSIIAQDIRAEASSVTTRRRQPPGQPLPAGLRP